MCDVHPTNEYFAKVKIRLIHYIATEEESIMNAAAQLSKNLAVVAKQGPIPETVIKTIEFFSGSSIKLPQCGQNTSLLAANQEIIDFIRTFIKHARFTEQHQ